MQALARPCKSSPTTPRRTAVSVTCMKSRTTSKSLKERWKRQHSRVAMISNILFRLAQLASRKAQFEDAVGYLNKVQIERLQPSLKSAYFSLLGKAFDKLGQFEDAFSAFGKQNELSSVSTGAKKLNTDGYLNSILLQKEAWTTDVKPVWANSLAGGSKSRPHFWSDFPDRERRCWIAFCEATRDWRG